MKLKIFILYLLISLTGCASINNESTLYPEFQAYKENVTKENILDLASIYFSPEMLEKIDQSSSNAVNLLLLNKTLKNINNYFEQISKQQGCLTINGYNDQKTPLTVSLKYINHGNKWLIDDLHIIYLDEDSRFLNRVVCPDQPL